MKKLIFTFMAALISTSAMPKEVLVDKIVAIVNDETKTMSDLREFRKLIEARKPKMDPEEYKEVTISDKKLLDLMVNETLLRQYAKEQGLLPTKDELDDYIKGRMKELGMNIKDLEKQLEGVNQTIDSFKEELKIEQIKARVFEKELKKKISVSEEDYQTFFKKEFHQEMNVLEYDIQHIVISNEALAKTVYKKIKDGADFKEMAKEYSEEKSSAANGGDLGFVSAEGLIPELSKAIKNMSPGDIKGPIKIQGTKGKQEFQIVKLSQLRNIQNPEYVKNKENIERTLIEKQFRRQLALFIDGLKDDAYVKTYL